jgi:heavy metal sensor kinase
MRRVPIRLRVAAAFAVSMAVVLAVTGWFIYRRLDSHLSTAIDRNLELRAQDLSALVRDTRASLATAGGGRFVERGETYAQLLDERGRVLDATRPLDGNRILTAHELSAARRETIFANRDSVVGLDEPSRLLATPIVRNKRRLVLVVGVTRQDRAETLGSLRDELLIVGPIALALATVAGYLLAGLSLRPVEFMRRQAAEISAETPGERLSIPPTGDEIQRLGTTLNEMLARLEAALERERDFVADAGHELRTPLALLRTELELAGRHSSSPAELRDAVRWSSDEVERLAQLADGLLLIARADRGRLPLQLDDFEAADVLSTVATRFEWREQDVGRPLLVESPSPLSLRADRIRIEQALGNLVDNALRYGAGQVRLSAARGDGAVELHVTDEGEGFPPEFLEQAFDRFTRADLARSRGGSGLGLSIVRVIAEAHSGDAHATNRGDGGADVWLTVPATQPPATT